MVCYCEYHLSMNDLAVLKNGKGTLFIEPE